MIGPLIVLMSYFGVFAVMGVPRVRTFSWSKILWEIGKRVALYTVMVSTLGAAYFYVIQPCLS